MEEYTNRELYLMLKGVRDDVVNGFKGVHDRQDKTNGGIGKSEDEIDKLKDWKNYIWGGISFAGFIISIIILIIKSFKK